MQFYYVAGADDASSQLGARHTNSSVQSSRPPSKPRDNNPGKVSNENSSSNQPSKRLQNLQSAQMSQTRPTKRSKTATLLGVDSSSFLPVFLPYMALEKACWQSPVFLWTLQRTKQLLNIIVHAHKICQSLLI